MEKGTTKEWLLFQLLRCMLVGFLILSVKVTEVHLSHPTKHSIGKLISYDLYTNKIH